MFKAIVGLFRIYSESLPVPSRRYDLNSIDHELHWEISDFQIFFFLWPIIGICCSAILFLFTDV